ncbi:Trm112 family protein [Streptomyces sp. NPDC017529]|uniref:Trm112 family protein n=1 Tax=Streptomyces sp. NPDC017529 TaxID=3365000 RepID=UPI00379FD584
MKPDDPLLKILVCPIDKGPLTLLVPDDVLYNPRLRRRYPILDGIPQLLPSSGEQVTDAEHDAILRRLPPHGRPADEPPAGGHPTGAPR